MKWLDKYIDARIINYMTDNGLDEGCAHDFSNWTFPETKTLIHDWYFSNAPTATKDSLVQMRTCLKCNKVELRRLT